MKLIKRFFLIILSILPSLLFSQNGSPDLSFGTGGIVEIDIFGARDVAYSIAEQNNGTLIVAGGTEISGDLNPTLVRFLPDGSIDTFFGIDGKVRKDYTDNNSYYGNVFVQADDNILALGTFFISGNYKTLLTRFLPNGDVDTTFGSNGDLAPFSNEEKFANMILLDDDSFLIVGSFEDNGIDVLILKKFLPNGLLDTSFGDNGLVTTTVSNAPNRPLRLTSLEDESIVVAIKIGSQSQQTEYVLIKYLADGIIDTTYGNSGMVQIVLEPDFIVTDITSNLEGKVYVSSIFYDWMLETTQSRLQRYLPDGDFDSEFGNNGIVNPNRSNFAIGKIYVQENQRIILHGEFTLNYFEGGGATGLMRYYNDGTLDTAFTIEPINHEFFVQSMLVQQDGKIVSIGHTPWYSFSEDFILERYNNNTLGISDNIQQRITLYPNPSEGIFTLESTSFSETSPYQITDVLGKVIQNGTITEKLIKIDLSSVQNGMYFFNANGTILRLLKI